MRPCHGPNTHLLLSGLASCMVGLLCGCYIPSEHGAQTATKPMLLRLAQFELGCPTEKLNVVFIDMQTAGVTGCGWRATYAELCRTCVVAGGSFEKCHCRWVLNNRQRVEPLPATNATQPAKLIPPPRLAKPAQPVRPAQPTQPTRPRQPRQPASPAPPPPATDAFFPTLSELH